MIVDGNALAGRLTDLLGAEPTTVVLRCRGCGSLGALAAARVYDTPMGAVARCRGCDTPLVTVVATDARVRMSLPGVRTVSID